MTRHPGVSRLRGDFSKAARDLGDIEAAAKGPESYVKRRSAGRCSGTGTVRSGRPGVEHPRAVRGQRVDLVQLEQTRHERTVPGTWWQGVEGL
jgi:hypothetical protein